MRSIRFIDDYEEKYKNLNRMNANINMQIGNLLREIERDNTKIDVYLSRIKMFSELLLEHTREKETDLNIDKTALFINTNKQINKIKIGNDKLENQAFITELNEIISSYAQLALKQQTKRTIIFDKADIKNEKLQQEIRSLLDEEVYSYTEYTL
ncbi:hypothetical protein ACLIJS_13825 [Mammaliicoccus sciuri]|uniref:hypothetical protein n=1 Tax=Mammaliicoccus sciuri TaxID=1296 RepID=UPI003A8DBD2D